MSATRIGELLISSGLITKDQFDTTLAKQKEIKKSFGITIIELGFMSEEEYITFLGRQFGLPSINLQHYEIDPNVMHMITPNVASKYCVFPIDKIGNTLTVAITDPSDIMPLDDLKMITRCSIEPVVCSETQIRSMIDKHYNESKDELNIALDAIKDEDLELLKEEEKTPVGKLVGEMEEAPIVKLVNGILLDAIQRGASDIHLEPYEKRFRVRYRIDGVLYNIMEPPVKLKDPMSARIKVMSQLDIAERRLPQDGQLRIRTKDRTVEFRVSVCPISFGEKICLRILDKGNLKLDMTKLGFTQSQFGNFKESLAAPYGILLVTGPTGSGKTVTLYSAMASLNDTETNIMTAEDPVEFNIEGLNQVIVKEQIGLTFAAALRSFLRQDPDVILVGEMRDYETCSIGIKAALTGHLVLSTLHTNNAPASISRMLDMGIEPFMISSSLLLALAQRLARRICPKCKQPLKVQPEVLSQLQLPPSRADSLTFYKGAGCDACNGTGYKGRVALYEIMTMNDALREMIIKRANTMELKRVCMEQGMKTLRQSGIIKALGGVTTIEEVLRVTTIDEGVQPELNMNL